MHAIDRIQTRRSDFSGNKRDKNRKVKRMIKSLFKC
jgi:hypothetical protein